MKYYFNIRLSYDEFLPYYQGRVQNVVAMSHCGQRIQFPAMHLRQYLTRAGINGKFLLTTQNNKFISIEKLTP